MLAPWLLFAAGLGFALLALNVYRPLRRPAPVALLSFLAGWLAGELPRHAFALQALTLGALVAAGGAQAWPGWVGLAVCTAAWPLLWRQAHIARRAPRLLEEALGDGLGAGYAAQLSPAMLARADRPASLARRLRMLPNRPASVRILRDVVYEQNGERPLHLDVYRGRDASGVQPVVLYVHGGGWVVGSKRDQGLPLLHFLAANGLVCVTLNYRLAPRAAFPAQVIDVKRALRWVRAHAAEHGGDPSRVVLAGGSAGGHLASLAALTPNEPAYQPGFESVDTRVSGCISLYGVYDFVDDGRLWRHGQFRQLLEHVLMKAPLAHARPAYEAASPLYRVHPDAPPFFVIHGSDDSMVPVESARRFVQSLRDHSRAPVCYAELPGAQHAFEILPSVRGEATVRAALRFAAFVTRPR